MRHLKDRRRLGMGSSHRQAVVRNLITSLILHNGVDTTLARAKLLKRLADKMITLAKKNDLHARRLVYRTVANRQVVAKLFNELVKHFLDRKGGYTRIYKLGFRNGDNAPMARIEYILPASAKLEKTKETKEAKKKEKVKEKVEKKAEKVKEKEEKKVEKKEKTEKTKGKKEKTKEKKSKE